MNPKPIFFPLYYRVLTFKPIGKPHNNVPGMEESGYRNWKQESPGKGWGEKKNIYIYIYIYLKSRVSNRL